jgi:hypothetical protein
VLTVGNTREFLFKRLPIANPITQHAGNHVSRFINAIRQLMAPSEPNKKCPIGFAPRKEK